MLLKYSSSFCCLLYLSLECNISLVSRILWDNFWTINHTRFGILQLHQEMIMTCTSTIPLDFGMTRALCQSLLFLQCISKRNTKGLNWNQVLWVSRYASQMLCMKLISDGKDIYFTVDILKLELLCFI